VKNAVIFADNSSGIPRSVGVDRGQSWVGASDLLGNIEEWTLSKYKDYQYDASDGNEENSEDWSINRAIRGGSWKTIDLTGAFLRAADRSYINSGNRTPTIGFRCVMDIE
jgi:formylglycine-generating enzyme required for sulfatase activity